MTKRQQAVTFFIEMGWTPEQSAGIVANLEAESGLRPDAVGDSGTAYGIAQWRGDRQSGFEALLGKPIKGSSLEDQCYWVHAELRSTEKKAGEALAACTTASAAADVVCRLYERPKYPDKDSAIRATLAERILAEWAAQDHAGAAIPVPPTPTQPEPQPTAPAPVLPVFPKEKSMFAALLPILLGMIPQLTPVLGPKTAGKVEMYGQLAQAITNAITTATGTSNLQAGLEAMQSDPEVKSKTASAVLSTPAVAAVMESQEAGGGGIGGARKAASDPAMPAFYKTGPFWISILLLLIVYAILADVLFLHPTIWTPSDRSQILMLAVAVTSGVMGYFLGSSISSAQKNSTISALSQ